MAEEIVNRVKANTKLVTIDLKQFHDDTPISELDIKQFLFRELMLKEQDFRNQLENFDWAQYEGTYLSVYCSSDAIIAPWAWMLITAHAAPLAKEVFIAKPEHIREILFRRELEAHDWDQYIDKFLILKGCSDVNVPQNVYALATGKLVNRARKIMYGEACSNVPVWKK